MAGWRLILDVESLADQVTQTSTGGNLMNNQRKLPMTSAIVGK